MFDIFKVLCALAGGFLLQRCVLPLKKGFRDEKQGLVTKGVSYLLSGAFLIYIYLKIRSL